jgi:cell division septation protein DedD
MRVFCPEHKRGFFAPRQSPIKCENRGHLLGEIDFEGEGRVPAEIGWQYCCNCEHFCPVALEQGGLERCPVCTRRSTLFYLCDRCHVISFESNTPLQTKNFTLTAEGVPQPSCPGCLRSASADLHEHFCDALGAVFITALNTCPICQDRLDVTPSFPSTVAVYLKRTRAANKVNVTFDYETESFVPVEDGEFVVATNSDPAVVLPRAPRFGSRRDFYEYYQDYYHCPKPDAGEVQIIQPATVSATSSGWKLETMGTLDVLLDQPKPKALPIPQLAPQVTPQVAPPTPAPVMREEVLDPKPPEPIAPVGAAPRQQGTETPCSECGALVESRYAFCWKCGNALTPEGKHSRGNNPSRGTLLTSAMALDDDELTVQHEMRPPTASVFPWTTTKQTEHPSSSRGSVLKLLAIGGVAFLLVSLGLFGLTRSADSQIAAENATATASAPQTIAETKPAPVNTETAAPAAQPTTETTPEATPSVSPEDELLARMRERRITATNSERPQIVAAFTKIERKYPRDYRFPYERAKLVAKGAQTGARNEAYKALSVAAEKAISAGKASEMLSGLETDKAGDFQRLAQERQEWARLVVALKRKDTSLLMVKTQFQ